MHLIDAALSSARRRRGPSLSKAPVQDTLSVLTHWVETCSRVCGSGRLFAELPGVVGVGLLCRPFFDNRVRSTR